MIISKFKVDNGAVNLIDKAKAWLAQLSRRDQLALFILSVFLLVFGIGGASYGLHQQANQAKQDAESSRNQYYWMRSQAPYIQPSTVLATDLSSAIRQVMSGSGIEATVVDNGDMVQLGFSTTNAAIIGNVLNQLKTQGVKIQRLVLTQPEGEQIIVEATLHAL